MDTWIIQTLFHIIIYPFGVCINRVLLMHVHVINILLGQKGTHTAVH